MAVLTQSFFDRSADRVARDLIGMYLVRRRGDTVTAARIIETEAYLGAHDAACHSAKGRTTRTEVMFGPPGRWYVYLVYGMHHMLNVVTGAQGDPAAVLIRGIETASGPGRVTKAFAVGIRFNGRLASPDSDLWFEDRGDLPARIVSTPRIGVAYAGPYWARRKLRFVTAPRAKTASMRRVHPH